MYPFSFLLLFHFIFLLRPPGATASSRSSICPVIIPQDPPSAPDLIPPSVNNRDGAHRIINGDLASINLQPYLVSIVIPKPEGLFACTGTLVSPRWVITAAHCQVDLNTIVTIGKSRGAEFQEQKFIAVEFVRINENFEEPSKRVFDIAVFRLAEPAPAGSKFMKVNVNRDLPVQGSFVRMVGYGVSLNDLYSEPQNVTGYLRQVDVPVTSENVCKNAYGSIYISYDFQVCAGYRDGKCDTCVGDSGGPMVQYNADGEPILMGITSFGYECARPGFPGVYVRPAGHTRWLDSSGTEYIKTSSTSPVYGPGPNESNGTDTDSGNSSGSGSGEDSTGDSGGDSAGGIDLDSGGDSGGASGGDSGGASGGDSGVASGGDSSGGSGGDSGGSVDGDSGGDSGGDTGIFDENGSGSGSESGNIIATLSTGVIAAIAIASTVVFIVFILATFFLVRCLRRRASDKNKTAPPSYIPAQSNIWYPPPPPFGGYPVQASATGIGTAPTPSVPGTNAY